MGTKFLFTVIKAIIDNQLAFGDVRVIFSLHLYVHNTFFFRESSNFFVHRIPKVSLSFIQRRRGCTVLHKNPDVFSTWLVAGVAYYHLSLKACNWWCKADSDSHFDLALLPAASQGTWHSAACPKGGWSLSLKCLNSEFNVIANICSCNLWSPRNLAYHLLNRLV